MRFEDHISVKASKATLEEVLADVPRVAWCMPGMEEVSDAGEGTYGSSLKVRVGPMGFTLKGKARVEQRPEQGQWTMRAEAHDHRVGGGVTATIQAHVKETSATTCDMDVTSDVQLMGRLGELGQSLIKRKAGAMMAEFGRNLQRAATGAQSEA